MGGAGQWGGVGKQKQPFGKLSAVCCASEGWPRGVAGEVADRVGNINNVLCAEPFARFEFGLSRTLRSACRA